MNRPLLSALLLLAAGPALADAAPGEFEPAPAPPELPEPLASGESIEPQVTIIRKDDALIEEYRINGALYMVKVTPNTGPAYYLIDNDGDGRMDTRSSDMENVIVPQWVLLTW